MSAPLPAPVLGNRAWFPDLAGVYLNHAAVSPPSLPVRAAIVGMLDAYARRGVGAVMDAAAQRERLRALLAGLIGAAPADIGLLPNTTHGVLAIANGLAWRRGDRVLCFTGEFPTNVVPWQQAATTYGLDLGFLSLDGCAQDPEELLGRLAVQLRLGVRLVAVSAVQFSTGLRMPLAEMAALCHAHGAELFVDAIQAVGVVPIDLMAMDIDYLSCGSHKWLMGVEGCGFLAVHPDRAAHLVPRLSGWLSLESPLDFLFSGASTLRYDKPVRQMASFVEVGAPNALGLAALEASVAPLLALGIPAIYNHVQAFHDALEPGLVELGFLSLRASTAGGRSGVLSVRVPFGVDLPRLHAALGALGISTSMPDGCLRFSPHWPNGLDQVPAVLAALDQALPGARG
jgi:cysteine desulfurase / selenocysteine lyase